MESHGIYLGRPFSRLGKSWKIAKVMEKSWKMMIMSWFFLLLH